MAQAKYLTSFDGAKIYYHVSYGDKDKWLIFLHGLGGDLTAWEKERRYFDSAGFSTIALDLRGHGLSARSGDKDFYKFINFSKDIAALVEAENIKKGVIVGHCFGGMISINFCANYPELYQGLVLIDTSYKPPFYGDSFVEHALLKIILDLFATYIPDFKTKGHANFIDFKDTSDFDLKRLLSDVAHTSLKSYLLICEEMVDYNAKKLLSKISKPTLVVDGVEDSIYPPELAEYLKSRIKHSELDLIPNANHILVLNNPADLEKSIHSFLKKIKYLND